MGAKHVANRRAFVEVFGDPSGPDPRTGQYQTLKSKGPVSAMRNDFDVGRATRNPASPNVIDFLCDVEKFIEATLNDYEQSRFFEIYIEESDGGTLQERDDLEQRLGRKLRENGITPVRRYFTTIRRGRKRESERRFK